MDILTAFETRRSRLLLQGALERTKDLVLQSGGTYGQIMYCEVIFLASEERRSAIIEIWLNRITIERTPKIIELMQAVQTKRKLAMRGLVPDTNTKSTFNTAYCNLSVAGPLQVIATVGSLAPRRHCEYAAELITNSFATLIAGSTTHGALL